MKMVPVVLALSLLLLQPVIAQNTSLSSHIPYIYYYSDILNGVVIERADGTDSRLIGDGFMSRPSEEVGNFRWSPTGRWLAWGRVAHTIAGTYYGEVYTAAIDGRAASVSTQFACVKTLVWHQTLDLLLLVGSVNRIYGHCDPTLDTFWLIDPETNTLLTSVTIEAYFNEYPPILYWQDDAVRFESVRYRYGDAAYLDYIVTLFFDGRVEIMPTGQRTSLQEQSEVDIPGREDRRWTHGFPNEPVFTMRSRDLELPFEPPVASSAVSDYQAWSWHENGDWVLLANPDNFVDSLDFGRHSIYNPDTDTFRELVTSPIHWLPTYIPLDELPPGRPISVLLAPLYYVRPSAQGYEVFGNIIEHMMSCALPSVWANGEDGRIEIWSYNSGTGERLETLFTLVGIQTCPLHQPTPMRYVVYAISPNERYLAITPSLKMQNDTFLYDISSGELIAALNFEGGVLSFSSDSTILYTGGRSADAAWSIEHLIGR